MARRSACAIAGCVRRRLRRRAAPRARRLQALWRHRLPRARRRARGDDRAERIRALILERASVDVMVAVAVREGMRGLCSDALEKVPEGLTAIAEVQAHDHEPALAPRHERRPLRIAAEVIDPRVQEVDPPVEVDPFDDVPVMLHMLVAIEREAVIGRF
jgi:hypothetical protein